MLVSSLSPRFSVKCLAQPCGEGLRVVETDFRTDPRWEPFVTAHPSGCISHHPSWLDALEREYGQRCVCLACEDADSQLQAVLPLAYTRGLPFRLGGPLRGRRLSSLPRTSVAGPLSTDRRATAALVRAAVERVRLEPGLKIHLKMQSDELDGLVDGVVRLRSRTTYVLALPKNPEELRFGNSRNHARLRWAINKAAKLGVQVRPGETEGDLQAWYELYLETMRWHAAPPRPYRFFAALWGLLRPRGMMRLLLAEQHEAERGRLLAGSIFLMFGQTVHYYLNGRRREALALRPNDVIQWRAIHDACRDGFRWYDLGEVEENQQGLVEFKVKWGAKPKLVHHYYYAAPRELQLSTLESGGHIHQLAKAAWRRLPLKATALLGDRVYSYL